eukprot:481253-Pyramimonas_sp.AAC.1
MPPPDKSDDEIADWLRGRCLCATECMWRVFGYDAYKRPPTVVCLPVHIPGEDWVPYTDGSQQRALDATFSALMRYFARPPRPRSTDCCTR